MKSSLTFVNCLKVCERVLQVEKWKSRKLEIPELDSHPTTLNALPGGELRRSLNTV